MERGTRGDPKTLDKSTINIEMFVKINFIAKIIRFMRNHADSWLILNKIELTGQNPFCVEGISEKGRQPRVGAKHSRR